MYFASRVQAGRMLANQLVEKYRYENCAVVALNDGGVMVGAQIASQLHCVLTMLVSEEINLPQEPVAIGGVLSSGNFIYNTELNSGDVEELSTEFRVIIEQEKIMKIHKMNELLGGTGTINREMIKGRNVILVSDGVKSAFQIDLAFDFLKPIAVERVIVATPLASVSAVDRIHILADEIYCLSVLGDYIDTPHYYDVQDVPDRETILKTIEQIILNWK